MQTLCFHMKMQHENLRDIDFWFMSRTLDSSNLVYVAKRNNTRAVLVFATKRKNNVDPHPRAQKKVNYVQLFFAK